MDFNLVHDKSCADDVVLHAAWSPRSDLISLVTAPISSASSSVSQIHIHRLSGYQRVSTASPPPTKGAAFSCRTIRVSWRPDGRVYAAFYQSGGISLHDVETGQCIWSMATACSSPVYTSQWITQKQSINSAQPDKPDPIEAILNDSFVEKNLPQLFSIPLPKEFPLSNHNNLAPKPSLLLPSRKSPLSLLLCGDESGLISIFAHGCIPIARINLFSSIVPLSLCLSQNIFSLHAIFPSSSSSSSSSVSSALISCTNTSFLAHQSAAVSSFTRQFVHLEMLLQNLSTSITHAHDIWHSFVHPFRAKFDDLSKMLISEGVESSVYDSLMTVLLCGTVDSPLMLFFSRSFSDRTLTKMEKDIQTTFDALQTYITDHLRRYASHLIARLCLLRGFALQEGLLSLNSSNESIGLPIHLLSTMISHADCLFFAIESLAKQYVKERKTFKALLTWIRNYNLRVNEVTTPFSEILDEDLLNLPSLLDRILGSASSSSSSSSPSESDSSPIPPTPYRDFLMPFLDQKVSKEYMRSLMDSVGSSCLLYGITDNDMCLDDILENGKGGAAAAAEQGEDENENEDESQKKESESERNKRISAIPLFVPDIYRKYFSETNAGLNFLNLDLRPIPSATISSAHQLSSSSSSLDLHLPRNSLGGHSSISSISMTSEVDRRISINSMESMPRRSNSAAAALAPLPAAPEVAKSQKPLSDDPDTTLLIESGNLASICQVLKSDLESISKSIVDHISKELTAPAHEVEEQGRSSTTISQPLRSSSSPSPAFNRRIDSMAIDVDDVLYAHFTYISADEDDKTFITIVRQKCNSGDASESDDEGYAKAESIRYTVPEGSICSDAVMYGYSNVAVILQNEETTTLGMIDLSEAVWQELEDGSEAQELVFAKQRPHKYHHAYNGSNADENRPLLAVNGTRGLGAVLSTIPSRRIALYDMEDAEEVVEGEAAAESEEHADEEIVEDD